MITIFIFYVYFLGSSIIRLWLIFAVVFFSLSLSSLSLWAEGEDEERKRATTAKNRWTKRPLTTSQRQRSTNLFLTKDEPVDRCLSLGNSCQRSLRFATFSIIHILLPISYSCLSLSLLSASRRKRRKTRMVNKLVIYKMWIIRK